MEEFKSEQIDQRHLNIGSSAVMSNTIATSHMWLVVLYFVAITYINFQV